MLQKVCVSSNDVVIMCPILGGWTMGYSGIPRALNNLTIFIGQALLLWSLKVEWIILKATNNFYIKRYITFRLSTRKTKKEKLHFVKKFHAENYTIWTGWVVHIDLTCLTSN